MKPTHQTRRTLLAEQRDYTQWPEVDVSTMDECAANRFVQLRMAIIEYLDGGKLTAICDTNRITRGEFLRRLNRCVRLAPDGRMWGWRALIFGLHTVSNRRMKPARPTNPAGHGLSGAFNQLLERHPAIALALKKKILKVSDRGEIHELRIDSVQLHRRFLTLCTEESISSTQYPFNTKSKGSRAIRRFVQKIVEKRFARALTARYGHDAAHRTRVGTGHPHKLLADTIFDVVQIDEHKLHAVGVIGVPTPHGIRPVPIQRLNLILVVEVASSAILGYAIVIRREAKASDFLAAVNCALEVWEPRELTIPGLAYSQGAGLPSAIIPELSGCAWIILQMDNAVMHYANAIVERVRRRVGCAINFGPVGAWECRPVVERVNKALEQRGFQRLPSSTGTNAGDPLVGNPNSAAVKYNIELDELLQITDVVIGEYNNTQSGGLSYKTPLEMLRDIATDADGRFLARHLPPGSVRQPPLSIDVLRCYVRGSIKEGRRPYIEVDRARYTSDILANAPELIGKELILHVDERDMRIVRAFLDNGSELGVLRAMGKWSRTPHTREMRKLINALKDRGKLVVGRDEDPVQAYTAYLTDKAARDAARLSRNAPRTSAAATELARAKQTTRQSIPTPVQDTPRPSGAAEASPTLRAVPRNIHIVHRTLPHR